MQTHEGLGFPEKDGSQQKMRLYYTLLTESDSVGNH